MTDQEIWNRYYMSKPISEVPTDDEQDAYESAGEDMLGGLIAIMLLIGAIMLVRGCV